MSYGIICWPDSQKLDDLKDNLKYTWLINGIEDYERYGPCAYVVDLDWWETAECMTKEESDEYDKYFDKHPELLQTTYDVEEDFGITPYEDDLSTQ